MKLAMILLALSAAIHAQAPSCAHVLRWAPQGAVQSFRNGMLQDDSAVSYTASTRVISPVGWADQDRMTYYYIREIDNPAHVPPSWYSAPIKESQVCQGTNNPPPVDFGSLNTIKSGWMVTYGSVTPQGQIFLTASTTPVTTTTPDGTVYDGVIFLDVADLTLKLYRKDGAVAPLARVSRQQFVGQGMQNGMQYSAYGLELWSVTNVAGSPAQFVAVPAPESITSIPACGSSGAQTAPSCLQPAKLTDPVLTAPAR